MIGENKTCTKCLKSKPPECFHRSARSPDGIITHCKVCVKIKTKAYYESHRETMISAAVKWNVEHKERARAASRKHNNSDTARARMARYAKEHPDEVHRAKQRNAAKHNERYRANAQVRYKDNRAAILARVLEWQKANPAKVQARTNRRRARKRNAPICDFTAEAWIAMQEAYENKCAYCGGNFQGKLQQEHVLPLCKKGPHTESNIVPACRSCNCKKSRNPPPPFVVQRPQSLQPIKLG